MKHFLIQAATLFFSLICISACGPQGPAPENVTTEFLKAIQNQEWDIAKKHLVADCVPLMDSIIISGSNKGRSEFNISKSWKTKEGFLVNILAGKPSVSIAIHLKVEKNSWKIDCKEDYLVGENGVIGKTRPYVALNVADHWWNPTESGWGLFIWHDRLDRLLAAWFTYGADNKPVWYTIQGGAWTGSNVYEGSIYQTTGPVFSAFTPGSNIGVQAVGTAKLGFSFDNTGTFTYTLNGVTQTKQITRFKP